MDSDGITSVSYVRVAMKVGCERGASGDRNIDDSHANSLLSRVCFHPHKLRCVRRHKGVQLQVRPAGRNVEINKLETRLEAQAARAVKD